MRMRSLLSWLAASWLFVLCLQPQQAQSEPAVSITPPTGEIARALFNLRADGLAADSNYTIAFLLDDVLVYSSQETSDAAGRIAFPVSSTEGDAPGTYTVQVRRGNAILATTQFELTTPAAPQNITVSPPAGPIGTVHQIAVAGLEPNRTYTIEISSAAAHSPAYRRTWDSDRRGRIELEIFAEPSDPPGIYRIQALDTAGELAASGEWLIEAPPQRTIAIEMPPSAPAGQTVPIALSGLLAFDSVTVQIKSSDRTLIDSLLTRAALDGTATLNFISPLDLPAADYTIEVFIDGTKSAAAVLQITPAAAPSDSPAIASPTSRTIESNAATAFRIAPDQPTATFELTAASGDSLNITVDSAGTLDTVLRVIAADTADDALLAFDDDSGPGLDAEISHLSFDESTPLLLEISSFDSGAAGSGTLTVVRNPARELQSSQIIITLNDKIERDLLAFDAQADELLTLHLERRFGDVEDLLVSAQVDGMEVMSYSTMGVPDRLPLAFVLPMSGRVLVALEKIGTNDGISLAVSLQRG